MSLHADTDFGLGGFARSDFTDSAVWLDVYKSLEHIADEFEADVWAHGRDGYAWPTNPLRWWSRRWEYPWIASQIARVLTASSSVLDIGAAVSFFDFYLAQLGLKVVCLDSDEAMVQLFKQAIERSSCRAWCSREIDYLIAGAAATGLQDLSFDAAVCVSVLEHISDWRAVVSEFARVIRPAGYLFLTLDVSLGASAADLDIEGLREMQTMLGKDFRPVTKIERDIPANAMSKDRCHCDAAHKPALYTRSPPIHRLWPPHRIPEKAFRFAARTLGLLPRNVAPDLLIYGGVWKKV